MFKSSKTNMQDFLKYLPAVLYEYVLYPDGNQEFLYMSPTAADILGYPGEHFIKDVRNFISIVHPDDLQRLLNDDATANQKNEFFVSEIRISLPSGQHRWIQMSSKPTAKKIKQAVIWSGYITDITERKEVEEERNKLIESLKEAMNEIKTLQGIIPVCAYCHSVRDDEGSWDKMESYISRHVDVSFSHGICPQCAVKARAEEGLNK